MADPTFPWQSDNLAGIESYACALDVGATRGPDPKTVYLLRMVNGWYGWNQGPAPLFGRDPRGISGGRYTGQQGAFRQQVASNTYSNGNHPTDTMTWSSLTGVPSTSRGDGWFVSYSDGGYTRYPQDITQGIFRPSNGDISNFSAYHMHSGFFQLGGGITGTWDIALSVPVLMDDVIGTMQPVFANDSANHTRFNALSSGGALTLGYNDFPFPTFANEFDIGTVNTAGYDGALISGVGIDGISGSTDRSFHLFYQHGLTPGILMAQSEVAVNTPYILVDWLQTTDPFYQTVAYTFLTATEWPAPVGGKVIIPIPNMLTFPAVAGSLFKVNWVSAPYPNGVIRHLIPGHTIASWIAAGRPF